MNTEGMHPLMPQGDKPVSWNKRYQASEDYILREVVGEYMLVCVGDSEAFGNSMISLNETFAYLWQQYQESLTLTEVLERAREEYDDPTGEMEQHIRSFLWQGVQMGLLVEKFD